MNLEGLKKSMKRQEGQRSVKKYIVLFILLVIVVIFIIIALVHGVALYILSSNIRISI